MPQLPGARTQWDHLAGTKAEVKAIAELAANRFDVMLRTETEAGESELRTAIPSANFIHLATHGYFAPNQYRSALASPAEPMRR